MSSTSFRPEATSSSNATIGKGVRIVGQIFTKEDLNIDGDVEGSIESAENKIIVGTNGRVQAGIKARGVRGSFGVTNNLRVEGGSRER